ncbi:MAG: DeoR/GlpR family DNA-binding transcription regulator [Sphaerochaetaceae bacterium]|jgi:DeoR family galactitol utilization operon repressor|nr:DeoR/GlpR family DNA-binding transcription regulator [Sphaerochaetaceae bacterium]MDD4259788.1 DeoR/GlpR family DNA-binding transcription regulator [Sphaerochaetaceae bacterium]MDD4840846.1 DeoR/GlpR family DNA-binding transcription regulator [Sphaerochaetaceae bacterium]NLO60994.1 DeoR/GlpR transcriptional regulator [Spirochaetales bacterium]
MVGLSLREEKIIELLQQTSDLSVTDLAKHLGVSTVTARADLRSLSAKGLIMRTRGSAVLTYHPLLLEKQNSNIAEKEAIAKVAASLVSDGAKIMITNGTTSALIAKYLMGKRDIQVVTNSTLMIPYARINANMSMTVVGGEFRPSAEAMVGPAAINQLQEYHVAITFTGTDGFTIERGLTTHLMENAEIVRKMCDQGTKKVLVSDSSKFGKQGFVRIFPMDYIDVLITDNKLPADAIARLKEMDIEVIIAN